MSMKQQRRRIKQFCAYILQEMGLRELNTIMGDKEYVASGLPKPTYMHLEGSKRNSWQHYDNDSWGAFNIRRLAELKAKKPLKG